MKMQLEVRINGMFWRGGAVIEIDPLLQEAFEPLDKTTDPYLSFLGTPEQEVERVIKLREDAAEVLAKTISEHLLHEMRKADTTNGYKNER